MRLSPQEHILLYTLVLNAGSVVSYAQLGKALGRSRTQGSNNAVARHITGLRRKLGDDYQHPRYIGTVVGIGYRCVVTT